MLYAAIARPPVVRGKVKSYNQKEVEAMSGVSGSIVLPPPKGSVSFQALGGVAVLANNTWNAFSAKKALKVEWDNGPNGDFDSDEYQKYLSAEVMKKGEVKRKRGDYYATTKSGESYKQSYEAPFLTHLQMEPVVATAEFKDGMCVVWSPTQNPQAGQDAVAGALGIEPKEVIAQVTLLGGGFGRKGKPDYCVEAALLSKQTGKPVQVVWTREDDVKHSYYHAMGAMHLEASFLLDKTLPTGLLMRTAFPGISSTFQEGALIDFPTILGMGFTDMPYHIDNIQCEVGKAPAHVRIGWLRSVANIQNVFALASFVDELAVRSKMDPVMFNEQLIGPDRVESKVPDGSEDPN